MADRTEGRLARWSRLKAKGGASDAEHVEATRVDELPTEADAPVMPPGFEDMPDPATLPGGVRQRNFVPPMKPLADTGEIAEDTPAYEAPPKEALAMLDSVREPSPDEASNAEALPEELPERELTEEEAEAVRHLPPLEELDKDSDFTPFLADNIPEFIRNRALRILWRSDPLFGFQDGLDDYAENFRVIDKLIDAATHSSYRPGQGYDLPEEADIETEETAGDAHAEAEPKTTEQTAAPDTTPAVPDQTEPEPLVANPDARPASDQPSKDG